MTRRLLAAIAARPGPLLLDAAIGTRLIARGLGLAADDPTAWSLDRPGEVARLHALDVAAGSDVVLTNTFGATPAGLARVGRAADLAPIVRAACRLAREAAGPDRFVLGSIGPTAGETADGHEVVADRLAAEAVDGLILETTTPRSALVALGRLRRRTDLPIAVSLYSVEPDGPPWADRLEDAGADILGINCVGPAEAARLLSALRGSDRMPRLVKPSAAPPGGPSLPDSALVDHLDDYLALGVRLVGGCCGATDAHLRALRSAVGRRPPSRVD